MVEPKKSKVKPISTGALKELAPNMLVERVMELSEPDLQDLCEATEKSTSPAVVSVGLFHHLAAASKIIGVALCWCRNVLFIGRMGLWPVRLS